MPEHQDKLNGSATAFIRAFSDLIKDSTSHLATKKDLDDIRDEMATKKDLDDIRADMATRGNIDTTSKNMQAQFARQEAKIAEIARKLQ